MSRSGYIEDHDQSWSLIRWRGAVKSAIRGRRGQAFLKEMLDALDALPEKRLIADKLEDGAEVCAIGAVGRKRGIPMEGMNPEDSKALARTFSIANALVCEIEWINDEKYWSWDITPEERFERVRKWIVQNLKIAA